MLPPGAGESWEPLLRKAALPALPTSARQHGTAHKTLGFLVQGAEPSTSRNALKPERLLLGCGRNVTSRALLFRRSYAITVISWQTETLGKYPCFLQALHF